MRRLKLQLEHWLPKYDFCTRTFSDKNSVSLNTIYAKTKKGIEAIFNCDQKAKPLLLNALVKITIGPLVTEIEIFKGNFA